MANDWSICPGMLCIESHGAILVNYQIEGLIEPPKGLQSINKLIYKWINATDLEHLGPPVIAFSMEQGLGVTVQRHDWVVCIEALLCVIKGNNESCLFYGIQGLLVLTATEVGLTGLCPGGPEKVKNRKSLTDIIHKVQH